ncbi:MAG: orotidine-5'-phosphate decarboxylase [Armatimonadota bacterium]|nr:orotidine-5'-phosphate decarboxylase [Armatimonadota bacterium]MDR5702212.1 orotidine-5'-phosphate decarboxylase [Armatimonadota bacterium]MDR7435909.1 orotidine-5'-phosphate decarboxylase [Armatimonadota bacterium]
MDTIADRLIVALDTDDLDQARRLVLTLRSRIRFFKVGIRLFTAAGPDAVRVVQDAGGEVFLDLKFLDIPASVAGAVANAVRMGVFMLNLHASGGREMLRKAREAAELAAQAGGLRLPRLIAVTLLTSATSSLLEELAIEEGVDAHVLRLARMAADAGLDGVVASPRDAQGIKSVCGRDFLVVSPGIRPRWAPSDDQQRVLPPREALAMGADFLVVGRPVTAAPDPLAAVERLMEDV